MSDLLFLLAGFFPLIFGANLLVDSASSLARKLNIPNIVIGLTIVAFGTSAPELVVNLFASFEGSSDITLGNVLGSNIFNIMGILGISAMIYPLSVKSGTTWVEIPLCMLAAALLAVIANDVFIDMAEMSAVTRIDGIVLLMFFVIFMAYSFQLMKSGSFDDEVKVKNISSSAALLLIVAGLLLLVAGGRMIVFFAVRFAREMGISERIIAVTIISIGTSLPELATSAVAALKKNPDIAIGNIVGSNIFNTFFILGISSFINPVAIRQGGNFDIAVNFAASVMLFIFVFTGKGRQLERWEGAILVSAYTAYVASIILL